MSAHEFVLLGAWGSKLASVAGHRCARCGMLYLTMNLTADEPGRIFAIGAQGEIINRDAIEAEQCDVRT